MTRLPKISVLTPIYNVEPFLPKCLDSLAAQTLAEIEFICVNDGSTDGSLSILHEYAARDNRFIVINKPNSGYGASMNAGLEAAHGEYIGIVESDDYAEPDMFERLYAVAKKYDCDIVRSNRFAFRENSDVFDEVLKGLPYDQPFEPLEVQEVFVPAPCIWAQVYRHTFLDENEIRFLETPGASFQDTGFVYKSYIAAERMVLIRDAFLHYRMDNMASSVKSSSKVFCVVDEFDSIEMYLHKRPEAYRRFKYSFEVLRYQAFQWNYNRLGWKARKEFLPIMAQTLRDANDAGNLSEEVFSVWEWDRIIRLIDDDNAVFDSEAPSISIIVPAYNRESHIDYTLDTLIEQTLQNIEIIVVNDGSQDRTKEIIEAYCAKDSRITLINQNNKGPGEARNAGLDHASGRYILFVDAEDGVPKTALELMYRSAEINGADCVIGSIKEFSPLGSNTFSRTESLSKKKEISRYDADLVWSFSVNNKLFRRQVIEELGLRFGNTLIAEDGLFSMSFVFRCGKIVGCPHVVLNYRRDLFWDGFSLTRDSSRQKVLDLVENHERIIELAKESIARDIELANTELERRQLAVAQITYISSLHQRLVSYLIDLQYRLLWLLDAETVGLLLEKVEEHKVFIGESNWQGMLKWHKDLPLGLSLQNHDAVAQSPQLSLVLCRELGIENVPEVLSCITHNGFPRFELFFPEEYVDAIPNNLCMNANMHRLPCSNVADNAKFKQIALEASHAPMIMFFDSRVFPHIGMLNEIWGECSNSQADFIVGKIKKVERDREVALFYRSQKVLFDRKHTAGFSYRDELNQLDCKLANKIIKTKALHDKHFVFSDNSQQDCKNLYELFNFKKIPEILFITDLTEKVFLDGTSRLLYDKLFCKRYWTRIVHDRFLSKKISAFTKRRTDNMRARIASLRPKEKITFFSNRGLSDNMRLVYEAIEGEKVLLVEKLPHSAAYDAHVQKVLRESKLIVLDDNCQYLRTLELDNDQYVVQLWHALGAFKKFGLDNFRVDPEHERKVHSQYQAVIVSSEFVRPIYAQAFGISVDKVFALGSSRSDLLLDPGISKSKKNALTMLHPELAGKDVILYCPTFRQNEGVQSIWNPLIDWNDLSEKLEDNEVFVIKPHPLERFDLLGGRVFDNITYLEDISTDDLLPSATLLITDYSSIVFDASLLDIPTLFYCPDFDEYQTGFYLNFPNDLCGELVVDYRELLPAIRRLKTKSYDSGKMETFKKKFAGSCDGHSTERIVEYLNTLIRD